MMVVLESERSVDRSKAERSSSRKHKSLSNIHKVGSIATETDYDR